MGHEADTISGPGPPRDLWPAAHRCRSSGGAPGGGGPEAIVAVATGAILPMVDDTMIADAFNPTRAWTGRLPR